MATSEEKQELVEKIKGPRYYRLILSGYGGESAYMNITKEQHDYWKENEDDLLDYMLDDDMEMEVPEEADFLKVPDEDYRAPWYESPCEYEHSYGVAYDSAYITVDEVNSADYMSQHIREIICNEDLGNYVSNLQEETDYQFEGTDFQECYAGKDVEYIAQMYSSEKGGFFDGIIETTGDFDFKKLVFFCSEYDNGEETITEVEYDGVEIDNQGGDTNGKGYSAHIWKNG